MELLFVQAKDNEKEEILKLYRSVLGMEGCAWTDQYPGMDTIMFDLKRDALFLMKTTDHEIVAAITIDDDDEVNALDCWSEENKPSAELSRLVVREDYQNHGLACEMVRCLFPELKKRGYQGIRYLVSKGNEKARRSYQKLHASLVGEASLFGDDFWCYEKSFSFENGQNNNENSIGSYENGQSNYEIGLEKGVIE